MNLRTLAGPVAGYLVSTVTVVGAVVLAALGHAVPDQLWTLASIGLGAGVGASLPGQHTAEPASTSTTAAAAAPTAPGV